MINRIHQSQRLALVCGIGLLLSLPCTALANSMEERLRAQLRTTTQELQALQGQHARTEATRAAAESQRDAARQELSQLRAKLERADRSAEQLRQQATQQIKAREGQLADFRSAYEELLQIARTKESERLALQHALTQRDGQLVLCTEKNEQLYDAARKVLEAYQQVTVGDVLRTRQPFAAAARVRFDEIIQLHGDALYEGRFDPLMLPEQLPENEHLVNDEEHEVAPHEVAPSS